MKFKTLVAIAFGISVAAGGAGAQNWPSKPVKIIVAYPPGQGTDVATRFIAEQLTKSVGQTFFVENKAGAGGNIGTAEAARVQADGYTLTMGTNGTHVLNQYLYPALGFDPEKDFEPVALVSTFPMVLLANSNSPLKTLKDVMSATKVEKGKADIALPSTTARLVYELLKERSGTALYGVPYRGSGAATTDVLGGRLPLTIDTVSAARSQVAAGKLSVIGVTSSKPTELLPGAPTLAQQGVEGFEVVAWNGLYAPRGTPQAIVQQLNVEVRKVLNKPDVRQRLLELGHEPAGGSPEQLSEFARSERNKWGPLIHKAGMKAD